jgi:apolipoprotein N-acyltransferase
MVSSVGRTAREQLTARYVLSLVAFLALAYGVTQDIETALIIAFGLAFVELISILRATPTVDSRWVGVGLGAFITAASLAWLGWELTAAAARAVQRGSRS